jgi:hypothetical protein
MRSSAERVLSGCEEKRFSAADKEIDAPRPTNMLTAEIAVDMESLRITGLVARTA